jgi:small subunit ribosomal protein S20
MPNIQSAKKSLRQTAKRAARNKVRRDAYKDAIKAALKEKTMAAIAKAQKALDKAAKTGVIKKNTAARKLSRLVKKIGLKK